MKVASILGPITLALIATASPSRADVIPATAGHQWPSTDGCITNPAWDAEINSCNDQIRRLWIIPIPVAGPVNVHAFATVEGNGFASTDGACQAFSIDATNSLFSFSSKKSNVNTFYKTLDLGILGVPAHGALHFECDLGWNGGRVANVEVQ